MTAPSPLRVGSLALPGVVTYDLAQTVQIFARGPGPSGEPDGFTLTVCTEHPGEVGTPDGFALRVDRGLDALGDADIVIVPGRYPPTAEPSAAVVEALRSAHERGATVASICIGAFVLGHAGLLDGRRVTTHWAFADALAAAFPSVIVDPAPLYIDDGDILTSSGFAAGLDLCLHLVRREAGAAAAARLARWNVVGPHREGGQAQFTPRPSPPPPDGDVLGPTLAWALDHLAEPLTTRILAERAHVSLRTLTRRFHEEVGTPPKQWLLDQRVALALELLETTSLAVDDVARTAGFPHAAALRHHLGQRLGTTPSAYRSTFASPP